MSHFLRDSVILSVNYFYEIMSLQHSAIKYDEIFKMFVLDVSY